MKTINLWYPCINEFVKQMPVPMEFNSDTATIRIGKFDEGEFYIEEWVFLKHRDSETVSEINYEFSHKRKVE